MAERIAYGDLNGDGTKDAAVLLAVNTGGSGVFKYLALVIPEKGKPVNLSTISLGDRVTIKTLSIRNGKIKVKMLTHSPTDPLCCPTQEIIQGYQLNPQTNQLMVTSLTEQELKPNAIQPELVPAPPMSVGDNVPVQPPIDEIEFRF
jgi:hypothetical protein